MKTRLPLLACHLLPALLLASTLVPLRADVVLEWNEAMLHHNEIQPPPGQPPLELRAYAMAHIAMFRAIEHATNSQGEPAAAGARAAHDVLVRLQPGGAESFHALLARQLAAIPDGPDKTLGLSIGAESATRLLAERADDGAANAEGPYQPGRKPGSYQFTPPFNAPPFNGYATYPKLGQVRPFALRSADQFRAPPPYTVLDPEYAFEYNEVRVMGAEHSSVRTADQTDAARFWYEMSAFGWNRLARLLSARRNDSLLERARLFAVLDAAMIDAFIASFESKYAYNFWRPLTAIQQAGTDCNPFTTPEPGWHPLMHTPPMPDYISTHAAQGGAAATVLIRFFGDEQVFTLPTTMTAQYPDLQPRTFQRISDAAVENALSRLYAGIHFRFACLTGLKQGREVGAWVVAQAPFAPR